MRKSAMGVMLARESVLMSALSILVALLFMLMFCPRSACAGEKSFANAEGSGSVSLPASVNGGPGKYSVARAGATGTVKTEYVTARVSFRKELYSWYGKHRLPFGNGRDVPWETLNRISLGLRHGGELGGDWGYFASVDASTSFENQIDGSLGLSATGGVVWKPTGEWTVRLGAGVVWHQIRCYPFPVAGVTYRPKAVKGLDVQLSFPYSHVRYQVSELLALRLSGEVDYGLYRLSSDSGVRRDGYVEFWGYSTGLWAELTPLEAMTLSLGCGWDFQGSVSLYRQNGEGHKVYSRAGTPRLGATLRYDF